MTLTSPPAMSSSLQGAAAWDRYTIPGMFPMIVRRRRSLSTWASSASCRPVTSMSRPIISAGRPSTPGTKTARSITQRIFSISLHQPVLGLGVRASRVEVAVELPGDALEVVRVHDVGPDTLAGDERGRVAPGERLEPLAEERGAPGREEVAPVGRAGQAADEAAHHLLALAQRLLGGTQVGDVADEPSRLSRASASSNTPTPRSHTQRVCPPLVRMR